MRYVVIGFCVFAAACTGASPVAPTSSATPLLSSGTTSSPSQAGREIVTRDAAQGGSELPFEGTYEGLESEGTPSSQHHLDATGNATHLGRFTVSADWTVPVGERSSTWTAANGDEFYTSFTRARATLTFTELHTILGGTGRFANASGNFTVVQVRALSTLPSDNSATIDGTINLGN